MNDKPMMICGHAANAISDGKPACAICGCFEVSDKVIDLTDRKARCSYYGRTIKIRGREPFVCKSEVSSRITLPFFEHKPESEHDGYYCGCWGWD